MVHGISRQQVCRRQKNHPRTPLRALALLADPDSSLLLEEAKRRSRLNELDPGPYPRKTCQPCRRGSILEPLHLMATQSASSLPPPQVPSLAPSIQFVQNHRRLESPPSYLPTFS